jgi:hypothetical protein
MFFVAGERHAGAGPRGGQVTMLPDFAADATPADASIAANFIIAPKSPAGLNAAVNTPSAHASATPQKGRGSRIWVAGQFAAGDRA